MSAKYTYYCNLCLRNINPDTDGAARPDGWALTWSGPGGFLPESGATLECIKLWKDSPIHLCQVCVSAVGKFCDSVHISGELKP